MVLNVRAQSDPPAGAEAIARPSLNALARGQVRRLQRVVPRSDSGVLILAYHLVGAATDVPVDLPTDIFRRHLGELQEHARIVSIGDALELLEGEEPISGQVVVLTFDDAYENFYSSVYELLVEMSVPATLYVPVDFIDGVGARPISGTDGLAPCTWTQLAEMAQGGLVTIGSHTCGHPNLRLVEPDQAHKEIDESRRRLELRLGVRIDSFCYPKGQWSRRLEPMVAGSYSSAVIGGGWKLRPGRYSPLRMTRLPIRRDMPPSLLPVLNSRCWLEEWIADGARRYLQ